MKICNTNQSVTSITNYLSYHLKWFLSKPFPDTRDLCSAVLTSSKRQSSILRGGSKTGTWFGTIDRGLFLTGAKTFWGKRGRRIFEKRKRGNDFFLKKKVGAESFLNSKILISLNVRDIFTGPKSSKSGPCIR